MNQHCRGQYSPLPIQYNLFSTFVTNFLLLEVEPYLGEELHLDLSRVIDDELVVVESVPFHLGHLGVLGRAHRKGKVITSRQLLHLVEFIDTLLFLCF